MALQQPPTPHQRTVAPQLPSPIFTPPPLHHGKDKIPPKGGAATWNAPEGGRGAIGSSDHGGTAGERCGSPAIQEGTQTLKRKRGRPALPGRVMQGVSLVTEVKLTTEVGRHTIMLRV